MSTSIITHNSQDTHTQELHIVSESYTRWATKTVYSVRKAYISSWLCDDQNVLLYKLCIMVKYFKVITYYCTRNHGKIGLH